MSKIEGYSIQNGEPTPDNPAEIKSLDIEKDIKFIDEMIKEYNTFEDLEDMEIDKILQEHDNKINNLLALVPKDLKAGEELETTCPNCGAKLRIAKASINGHLWITCEKEGVLICQ